MPSVAWWTNKQEIKEMKCIKCKFKDENTGVCTYPFKATAAGDTKFDKDGNMIGCTHGKKK